MAYNNNNEVKRSDDPEQIDLIDIVMQLKRGKWIIGGCVALALVLAGAYLAVAKDKWVSTAIISQPDAAQIGSYINVLNVLYENSSPKVDDIQSQVIGRFTAQFAALSSALKNQVVPEKLTIAPSVAEQPLPLVLTYTAETADAAQKQLAVYIQKVDEQVAKEMEFDLNDSIKQHIALLKSSLSNREMVAEEQKALRIKQIGEALKFAEAAKITAPQVQQTQEVTQDSMFLLGTEALGAMIQREATRPLVFSDDYYATKQKLLDSEQLEIDPAKLHSYRYVMKPDLPVHRDSPKPLIALVLAALLGAMVGSGVVIMRNALRNYKSKSE